MSRVGEAVMPFVGGSKRSFRCECDCNVFTVVACPEHEIEYRCNACGLLYGATP